MIDNLRKWLFWLVCFIPFLILENCDDKQNDDKQQVPCQERAVFGNPGDSKYVLPFPVGRGYYLSQSYCNPNGGHKNQLAYDFAMKIGDTVCAAREGQVLEIRDDLPDNGYESDASLHNHIFILHTDGTVGFYAHLKQNQVMVEADDIIQQGQSIALSGNSGNTGNFPHLHFGVYRSWPAKEGFDVGVNFKNAEGQLDEKGGLMKDKYYKALAY
jgi:murein DD-endopeptidase MepM/ murein hydrolase activator NlpD